MSTILPHLPNPVVSQHHVTHAMGVAFDEVCRALYLLDDAKAVRIALVAEKIIEHSQCSWPAASPATSRPVRQGRDARDACIELEPGHAFAAASPEVEEKPPPLVPKPAPKKHVERANPRREATTRHNSGDHVSHSPYEFRSSW
jgi:hypothetical protein